MLDECYWSPVRQSISIPSSSLRSASGWKLFSGTPSGIRALLGWTIDCECQPLHPEPVQSILGRDFREREAMPLSQQARTLAVTTPLGEDVLLLRAMRG
ncbi:hypothetical protein, partial [Candidatus Thiosymbion oneisti]